MGNYIIYGAAAIGDLAKKSLEKHGIRVIGYIDKRAFEIKNYNELPVWDADGVPQEYKKKNTVLFIGVKNVFEHEQIARMLVQKGFEYIIYKPHNVLLGHGTNEENQIAEIYDMLFDTESSVSNFKLPKCQAGNSRRLYDFALMQEEDNQVVVYIPAEFIATNNYQTGGMVKWGNVNILSFFTHIDFFRSFENYEDASPQPYLKEYCEYTAKLQNKIIITKGWQDNVIKNRAQIYEKMSEAMNLDKDFFARNAPTAEWNSEKYIFNLTSGKHRSTFLAAKGMKYIPIKISSKDYQRFYHKEELLETYELWMQSKREIAIAHPVFYRDPGNRDRGEYAFISWFARFYGKRFFYEKGRIDFSGVKILDLSDDLGNLARFLGRLGCDIERAVVPERLELQLNRLFYASVRYCSFQLESVEKYDIVIVDEFSSKMIMENIAQYNEIIIRSCGKDTIDRACEFLKLVRKKKINIWYEGMEVKESYLLGSIEE